jgi:hypothetical protein
MVCLRLKRGIEEGISEAKKAIKGVPPIRGRIKRELCSL